MIEAIALALPDNVQGDAIVGQLTSHLAAMCASEVGPMKLLQIKTEFSMLLRVIDNRRGGAVSWCMLSGEQPNPLQAIDRCTAENCRQCLHNVFGGSLRSKGFEQRFRGTCLDRAPVNAKTERGVRIMDAPHDHHLKTLTLRVCTPAHLETTPWPRRPGELR